MKGSAGGRLNLGKRREEYLGDPFGYGQFLREFHHRSPSVPVISGTNARETIVLRVATSAKRNKSILRRYLRATVSIEWLITVVSYLVCE
jgi:hypothetical protein